MKSIYNLLLGTNLFVFNRLSLFTIFTRNKIQLIKLPKFYYLFSDNKKYVILVFSKIVFKALLFNILNINKALNTTKFIKLKIKGLGYEVKECTLKIHSFCFN